MSPQPKPWLAIPFLAACGGQTDFFDDEGSPCVRDDRIEVVVDACISTGCDILASAVCEGTWEDDVLQITSQVVVRRSAGGFACEDQCSPAVATCTLPTPPDAPAALSLGDASVPWDEAACL